MIKLLDDNHIENITKNQQDSQLTVKISALIATYGTKNTFFKVWEHNDNCIIARLDNSFFVYAPNGADFEEIAVFFGAINEDITVSGQADSIQNIAYFVKSPCNITYCNIAVKSNNKIYQKSDIDIDIDIETNPKLELVYEVLKSCEGTGFTVGKFDSWYVDISHRIRHGCGRTYLITNRGQAAACCIVTALSDFAGLIGGVAVKPQFRAKGFASALIKLACEDLHKSRRLSIIECNDNMLPFYVKMGFTVLDRGACLSF